MEIQPLAPRQAADLTKERPISQSLKLQGSEFKNVFIPQKCNRIQEAYCLTQHVTHLFHSLSNVEQHGFFD